MRPRPVRWQEIPLFGVAMFATYVLHEAGHWAAGRVLGYEMWVTLNGAGLVSGSYANVWHQQLVTAAGPLVTIVGALIAYAGVRRRESIAAFAFLFSALMMRFTAMLVSISAPNDEARISEWLGLGRWTLFAVVVLGLLALTVRAGRTLKFGWKSYGLAYLAVSVVITAVVLGAGQMPRLVF